MRRFPDYWDGVALPGSFVAISPWHEIFATANSMQAALPTKYGSTARDAKKPCAHLGAAGVTLLANICHVHFLRTFGSQRKKLLATNGLCGLAAARLLLRKRVFVLGWFSTQMHSMHAQAAPWQAPTAKHAVRELHVVCVLLL